MREEYIRDNLVLYRKEVVVLNDKKLGKVKLGFKDLEKIIAKVPFILYSLVNNQDHIEDY
jgi:hypothetical protein